MSSENVENLIRNNVVWSKLPEELKIALGNSQREYDKRILEYSIRNQLRFKDNIVRFVKKKEEDYYENLLSYSQTKMMLYPYHLSDILVRELRVTPFTYYSNMMIELMQSEKSYDSLPNFTAADSMQIMGIGRNQYIDIINASRSNKKLFRRSKSIKEILPQKPASTFLIESWYLLCYGCILENDVKLLSSVEKNVVDQLVDGGPIICGTLNKDIVIRLINRGLVYLDVPIKDDDYIYVTTLDGFVMNRVLGDYFETLLYKIFVAVDGQTSVKELAETIGIDQFLVKNALSVFCRLGFAKKRVNGSERTELHKSWIEATNNHSNVISPTEIPITFITTPKELTNILDDDDDLIASVENLLTEDTKIASTQLSIPNSISTDVFVKRIAFVFDSTLTAFLMMGNLSANLKNHAVTLFEVGKLSDEALDCFINELQNVNFFVEGEVHRYSQHAKTLLHTIQTVRLSNELDLIRGESLWNLDENARSRVIQKCYKLVVSMAPLNVEACSLPISVAPHLGTPSVEVASAWFRLFLYEKVKSGPTSIFLPMGCRLSRLPLFFWKSKNLMLNQGTHESIILSTDNSLITINELLESSPVFIQSYGEIINDSEIVNVPFSFKNCTEINNKNSFYNHPVVTKLNELFNLDKLSGYIILMKLYNGLTCSKNKIKNVEKIAATSFDNNTNNNFENDLILNNMLNSINNNTPLTKDPKKTCSNRLHLRENEEFSEYVLLDCVFGVPLFDDYLNKVVCQRIVENNLLNSENIEIIKTSVQNITNLTKNFINQYQENVLQNLFFDKNHENIIYPTNPIVFDSSTNQCYADFNLC